MRSGHSRRNNNPCRQALYLYSENNFSGASMNLQSVPGISNCSLILGRSEPLTNPTATFLRNFFKVSIISADAACQRGWLTNTIRVYTRSDEKTYLTRRRKCPIYIKKANSVAWSVSEALGHSDWLDLMTGQYVWTVSRRSPRQWYDWLRIDACFS